MKNKIKSITLCSSVSFYRQNLKIKPILEKMGFKVWVEKTALIMRKTGDYRVSTYKTWYKNPKHFKEKARLIRKHFRAIEKGDAILVVNLQKKGIDGYIGGNVLMEMGLAFYLKKPIFLLYPISKKSPVYEEVMGVMPRVLDGNLAGIR